jgi:hypothetical protein
VTATVAVPGALAVALAVGLGGELSPAAHVAVLTAGGVVLGAGLMGRAGAGSPRVDRRSAPWLGSSVLILVLVLAWEAVAMAHAALPTISDLLDPVLEPAVVRATATLVWVTVGARLSTRPGPTIGAAMRTTTGRALVLLAWLWVGLHFLAR